MYLPDHFKQDDLTTLHDAMDAVGLAIVTSNGTDGPEASHLPLVLDRTVGKFGALRGHFARANGHWRALEAGAPALIIFPGPDAYISPSWYPSKRETGKVVPTWNYVAIHAAGPVSVFHEPERLLRLVSAQTSRHEQGRSEPWAVSDAPSDYVQKQLAGIVGFEMLIERLDGKWKLSQNRSEADRTGALNGLRAEGAEAVALAQASSASRK
ncbi:transcriptional regulator [Paramagnetospirillum kuznetsovii]|uniref:Transcriptional regulator n=1 Tax=Paramagnetospirillum kuznetsovii TaxID=2053833 RepID=A0A364NYE3_9PROT|nr:FMN-binding negative transcriptional regulator [Paramagnetospirillum kuznetsovii]RAU22073.1 transcriptional regulator [Paramagnetospirillum kuznetsovii]